MGKLIKPKKPSVKRPRVPAKPKKPEEPEKHISVLMWHEDWFGDSLWDSLEDKAFKYSFDERDGLYRESMKKIHGFLKFLSDNSPEKDGISFKKDSVGGASILFPNPKYKKELKSWEENLVTWEGKVKGSKPRLEKYELAMREYKAKLHKWKIEKAREDLRKLEKQSIAD